MITFSTITELTYERTKIHPTQKIGFVPTMGFLHEGHLSLINKAREENDKVFVSIFVNPTQFGPKEDLSKYPRDLKRDLSLLEKAGVDVVFTPDTDILYPNGFQTYVVPTGLIVTDAEGAIRPGHFKGVATIVVKLLHIVKPTDVYFGQKDAQQALVVSRVIKDLNIPSQIHVMPIIREKDGLAMSSRNIYLSKEERTAAAVLYKSLQVGKDTFDKNLNKNIDIVLDSMRDTLVTETLVKPEYIEIRHTDSFTPLKTVKAPALILVAAKVGKARLIDNFVINTDGSWDTGKIL